LRWHRLVWCLLSASVPSWASGRGASLNAATNGRRDRGAGAASRSGSSAGSQSERGRAVSRQIPVPSTQAAWAWHAGDRRGSPSSRPRVPDRATSGTLRVVKRHRPGPWAGRFAWLDAIPACAGLPTVWPTCPIGRCAGANPGVLCRLRKGRPPNREPSRSIRLASYGETLHSRRSAR
jgi:hypothetical protein